MREGTPRQISTPPSRPRPLPRPSTSSPRPRRRACASQLAGRFAVDVKKLPADFKRAEPGRRYPVDLGDAPAQGPADAPVQPRRLHGLRVPVLPPRRRGGRTALRRATRTTCGSCFRHLPLPAHRGADGAARAAVAADAGPVLAVLRRCSRTRRRAWVATTFLAIARALGLDEARFLADLDGPAPPPASARTCSSRAGSASTRTPAFFLNGRYIRRLSRRRRRSSPTSTPSSRNHQELHGRGHRPPAARAASGPPCWLAKVLQPGPCNPKPPIID
jgi:hypothetical protein